MTVHAMPDRSSARGRVAAEVRADLARNKITINQLPGLLGNSQSYWSRRINGVQPMDVDDLSALGSLLAVPVSSFFATLDSEGPRPADPSTDASRLTRGCDALVLEFRRPGKPPAVRRAA